MGGLGICATCHIAGASCLVFAGDNDDKFDNVDDDADD